MTILIKDMGSEMVTLAAGSLASGAYTATDVHDVALNSLINPELSEQDYSFITDTGRLNTNRATQPKGIYLASNQETSFVAAQLFYVSGPEGITVMNWKFRQFMKTATLGAPIYVGGPRYYYAKWYGTSGLGLYCFVGYSAAEAPSQTVAVANSGSIYEAIYGSSSGTTSPAAEEEGVEITEGVSDKDIIISEGYDNNSGLPIRVSRHKDSSGSTYFTIATTHTNGTVTVTTTVPNQSASGGVSSAPTYQQLVDALNRGWNTWARSINPLSSGSYLLFTTMAGIDSANLAIGPAGMEGRGIPSFAHSLIIDSEGVKVHEQGIIVHTMKTGQDPLSTLRIYRHTDNTIHYVVTTGTTTIVYKSLLACPYPLIVPLYVYGHLYSSGDKVTAASFRTGEIHYGSI